jgi:hypothetical protein
LKEDRQCFRCGRSSQAGPQLLLPRNTITEIKYLPLSECAVWRSKSAVQATGLSPALRTPAQRLDSLWASRHMKSQCRVSPFPAARKNMCGSLRQRKRLRCEPGHTPAARRAHGKIRGSRRGNNDCQLREPRCCLQPSSHSIAHPAVEQHSQRRHEAERLV